MDTPIPSDQGITTKLDIAGLAPGVICPPFEPGHPSWKVLSGWEDPLAPLAAYRRDPCKQRVTASSSAGAQPTPAIQFDAFYDWDRSLEIQDDSWRDLAITAHCRLLETPPRRNMDEITNNHPRAGIVFRVKTSRHYYQLCIEANSRLVLYRRQDDLWDVLAQAAVRPPADAAITLEVRASGDRIEAGSPELGIRWAVIDDILPRGRAGFRVLGSALLWDLRISRSAAAEADSRAVRQAQAHAVAQTAAKLPSPRKVGVLELASGQSVIACGPVRRADEHLWLCADDASLFARTFDGKEIWRFFQRCHKVELAPATADRPGRVYVLFGERRGNISEDVRGRIRDQSESDQVAILDGGTGRTLHQATLPLDPDPPAIRRKNPDTDFAFEVGASTGPGTLDFMVKQNHSAGAFHFWAFDAQCRLLWHHRVRQPFGHHNAIHYADVNGDGRPEVIAGGTLLDAQGNLLWEHDRFAEFDAIEGGQHYDAVGFQEPARGPQEMPLIFLIGGSAGVYVVDALSGRTLMVHRMGHAQWTIPCRLRDDLPGRQWLVGTRWGNFGILSLFSHTGQRLWTIQPDYILQGCAPVDWIPGRPQLLWHNTSEHAQGLYDGLGRRVHPLDEMRLLWRGRTAMDVKGMVVRLSPGDASDTLGLLVEKRQLHLFQPG